MFLILVLLMIGIFSFLERVLLASVQYRQGPMTAMLHGFSQVVADGIKIYSKHSLDVLSWGSGIFVLGLSFTCYVGISMLLFSSSLLPVLACDIDLIFFLTLSGFLGCLCILPMVVVSNRYASLGCLRHLRALIVAEIGLDTSIFIMILFFVTLDTGGNLLTVTSSPVLFLCLIIPVFILMLISAARAPFDMPEAESELVAGSLTDIGGTAFSLCLLFDYLEILAWSTLLSVLLFSYSMASAFVIMLILISYIGRIILCRILLTDIPRLLFLVLLWQLGILLNVFFI